MSKINPLSTLFIGIDVSSRSNVVYAMDFEQNKLLSGSFPNNQPGAEKLEDEIRKCMLAHQNLNTIVATLESTSVYSIHIANFLSSSEVLMPFSPYVYCINPKMTANYRKSFVGLSKTDPLDSFLIADFARVGRVKNCTPWRGSQFLALKRLTRHRLHLAECITREKTYMISNLYLKFSELELLDDDQQPFSNIFGATSSAVLTEFFSVQDIIDASEEDLLRFLAEKSHNRISDLSKTSELLKKADSALYGTCRTAEKVVIIRGQIENDSTLDYMRNVIGICEAFIDKGAKGILDLQTFTLYSPGEWTSRFFGKDVNAQNHVLIMFSKEDDRYWIHTRGMAEFGRPDYGISKVPEDKLEDYKQVIDQMVFYGGQGLVFKGSAKLHTFNGKTFRVATEFVNDFDNDDYNNAYYNVTVIEEL